MSGAPGPWGGLWVGVVLCGLGSSACFFDPSGMAPPGTGDTGVAPDVGSPPDGGFPDSAPGPDGSPGDLDGDGFPDGADNCRETYNPEQLDDDQDGVGDLCDNCISDANELQEDMDDDGQGDVCDGDRDGDLLPNARDPFPNESDQVEYFSELETSEQHFWVVGGSWEFPGNGAFCQSDVTAQVARSRLQDGQLFATDYLVETQVSVLDTEAAAQTPYAGITFRSTDVDANAFDGYVCAVDLANRTLDILSFDDSTGTLLNYSAAGSVPATGPYRLRVTAAGSVLTCELLPSGPVVQTNSTTHPAGTVGFFTHRTAACFDYLVVVEP